MLLIDQFTVGHDRGSSHGPSRISRLAYDSLDYVALARASYALWHELEAESGERLLTQIGGLDLGSPDALALDQIRAAYMAADVPFEALDRDAIMTRYPQFNLPEGTISLYQIVIASPCSGHGFKFGAVIGRILADLALHGTTANDIARFQARSAGASYRRIS